MNTFIDGPLNYKKTNLYFDRLSIGKLIKENKTPFYLYSLDYVSKAYLTFFNKALEYNIEDPLICFALKANPNKEILKCLKSHGCGADTVSAGEIKRAIQAKISPQKIVFSGVGKTDDEIEYALGLGKNGIYSFNVESIDELRSIAKIARKLKRKARVCFRLNPEVSAKTHKNISTGDKSHKFGILTEDILCALKEKSIWKSCELVGLSIHIGSQLTCLKATKKAIGELCSLYIQIGKQMEFIDIGGGLGVQYHPDEKISSIDEYMKMVSTQLEKSLYSKINHRPRVVFEPGRYITAKSGVLVSKVVRQKSSDGHHFLILDSGMNDFARTSLYDAYHHILPVKDRGESDLKYNIVGPICESTDLFARNRNIGHVKTGDYIVISDTGAYGHSMASQYNLRDIIKEVVVGP